MRKLLPEFFSAALASWGLHSSSFVLNISWTHCRLSPDYHHEVTGLIFWCWRFWRHGRHQRWLAEPKLALRSRHGLPGLASASSAASSPSECDSDCDGWLRKATSTTLIQGNTNLPSHTVWMPLPPCHFSSACPNTSRGEYTLANFKINTGRWINIHQSCFSQLTAIHGKFLLLVLLSWVTSG